MAKKLPPKTLNEALKAKGFSHETLAAKVGVTRPAVSHWTRGKRGASEPVRILMTQVFEVDREVVDSWFKFKAA